MHMPRLIPALFVSACLGLSAYGQPVETPEALLQKAKSVLAQLDGELKLPGLKEPVEVLRDRWGVPHIYARNADDLFFAQGFVVAQDRLFQIDLWRRIAVGETSEIVGKKGIDADRFARLVRFRGDIKAEWTSYSPHTQQIAVAFTRGINAAIDHMGDRLPIEFQLLGYKPAKWQPEDILGRMAGIIMTRNFRDEVLRAELIAAVGVEKARRIAPVSPVHDYGPVAGLDLAGIDRSILAGYDAATKTIPLTPKLASRGKGDEGSNNWAIDGSLSASGKPMLASDPHRPTHLPSLRYLTHLNAPGWNVIGSGEPALPGIALGHNESVAWGITIVGTDQADLIVEETKPDDPMKYRVGDQWEPIRVLKEKIRVKGEPAPVEVELRFTRNGPVVHTDEKRNRAFALRWVGSEAGSAGYLGSLSLCRATSGKDLVARLDAWKLPSENVVYADVQGNIGWVATALTPIRKGWDGLLPVPGKYQWQGFLAVKDLPQVHNPANHFVVTANSNMLPADYKHEIAYEWSLPYRYDRLRERLAEKKKFTLDDSKTMQHDNVSIPGRQLARIAATLDLKDAAMEPYRKLLAGWDGELSVKSQAGPLYGFWLQEMLDSFFRSQVPANLVEFVRGRHGIGVMLAVLEKPDRFWFGNDPVAGRDLFLRSTFISAVGKTKKALGDDPREWTWGKLHTTTFHHPLAQLGPVYEKAFNLGPVSKAGDALTPHAASHNAKFEQIAGASYRQIFDLADWDRGVATSVPGQSGQPGSPYYSDLLPLWAEGQYFPLAFTRKKVEEVTAHRLMLKP
jgi:penicillin G amidase